MQISLRKLTLLPLAGFLTLIPTTAAAQFGDFTVSQHGQPVGTATFHFTSTPQGYDSTSVVRIAMQGLDYALPTRRRSS